MLKPDCKSSWLPFALRGEDRSIFQIEQELVVPELHDAKLKVYLIQVVIQLPLQVESVVY